MRRFTILSVLILLLVGGVVQAQQPTLDADATLMLSAINRSRLRENLVHLVPNAALNAAAQEYANDLKVRMSSPVTDIFVTSTGRTISQLLSADGYPPYADGYVVDFVPMAVRNVAPADIITYWVNNSLSATPTLPSLRISQGGERILPIFSPLYREIGIGLASDALNNRNFYVIIFAAQPDVLPVIVTVQPSLNEIAQTTPTRDVILYVHDERARRIGTNGAIGAVTSLRISEQPGDQPCQSSDEWKPYRSENVYKLSDGFGLKTIYVQLCDRTGVSVTSTTQVNYAPGWRWIELAARGSRRLT